MTLQQTSKGTINIVKYSSKIPSTKTILCIHGFCCDGRIFDYLGNSLTKEGFDVYSIDLPGHGKSYGEKGDPNFDDCLESIRDVVQNIKNTSKIFLLAHSMGCTYALWYAHNFKNTIDGLILLAPYLRISSLKKRSEIEPSNPRFLYFLLRKIFTPKTKMMATQELPNFRTVGGSEIEKMLNDKTLNFYYSYRYIVNVLALRNTDVSTLSKIEIPVFILHGNKDRNVFSDVSVQFCNMITSNDKKITVLDCDHWFNHCIFYDQTDTRYSEESRTSIVSLIKDWLLSH